MEILAFVLIAQSCLAFQFRIDSLKQICFQDDLLSQTLAVVEASSYGNFSLRILDNAGFELYENKAKNHIYSWAAFDSGIYDCCVKNLEMFEIVANFVMRKGVQAKDYSGIASVKGIKGIEVKLKGLEDLTKDIHKKIQHLREREEELRNTNKTIHSRVIVYSIVTVSMLLGLCILQILYLKRFSGLGN